MDKNGMTTKIYLNKTPQRKSSRRRLRLRASEETHKYELIKSKLQKIIKTRLKIATRPPRNLKIKKNNIRK
jgi:hypothetical protein